MRARTPQRAAGPPAMPTSQDFLKRWSKRVHTDYSASKIFRRPRREPGRVYMAGSALKHTRGVRCQRSTHRPK